MSKISYSQSVPADGTTGNQTEYELVSVKRDSGDEWSETLDTLTKNELEAIQEFLAIYRADEGHPTPAENLICTLVRHHSIRGLTPEDVDREVEEFREQFDVVLRATKKFNRRYPELVIEGPRELPSLIDHQKVVQ